jgi:predicted alpha/beta superfamily hydrolase
LNEYCPYDFSLQGWQKGKGEGDLYLQFLTKTLKPFIDKKYRTLKDQKNTFTAGSSMGDLFQCMQYWNIPKYLAAPEFFLPHSGWPKNI